MTNKSSRLSVYSPRNVHAALQPFMIQVSSDEKLFGQLIDLNSAMSSLWDCARGSAAAGLLVPFWDSDFSILSPTKNTAFIVFYPHPNSDNEALDFNVLFIFRSPPNTMPGLTVIGNPVVSKSSRSAKGGKHK